MATYERTVRVRAPLERVWAFHSDVDGLRALTPGWANLRIGAVTGPAGEANPSDLVVGTEIDASVRPFGVGPRQHWRSRIVGRERTTGTAYFRDEMVDGPLPSWLHTHLFYADGEETIVRDHVQYELPVRSASRLGVLGLEPAFRYRHRRTRALLE